MAIPSIGIITGPTGVGKTELALSASEFLNAEIVNADSMQIYRYMDVGTAKPTVDERKRVPHHLIDVRDPDETCDASTYRRMADEAIRRILEKGKRALLVGGTGLYIKALLHGLFPVPPKSATVRARLKDEANRKGLDELHRRLLNVDPLAAQRIHPRDRVRIVRALEVYETTKTPISRLQAGHRFQESSYRVAYCVLSRPKPELYARIENRTDQMLAEGLVEEVKKLKSMGYGADLKSMQSIGYRHVARYLENEWSFEEATRLLKRDTRRYAKRQLTWFQSVDEARWFHPDDPKELLEHLMRFFEAEDG
ncbi:MAG: tRNA (adenosine(37)-N6)-dimethylallyltransferase MiaA [Deltaproteobacteria bacterium]|nr:tRNA (adenosine(37)-N6)-dimethylallyltransferase MiaA [Deltaproteobacteria bacterium]